MTTSNAIEQTISMTNGVDVGQIMSMIDAIEGDPGYAQFQFRATNHWIDGGLNRSRIKEFFAGNAEDETRSKAYTLDADEAAIAGGKDTAPTPVEYVLHALASCLTTTLVYHAAVNGIAVEAVDSSLAGDIDVRGVLGLRKDVRKSLNRVTVNMRVKSGATADELTELAGYSPVYDMVSRSLPVELMLTTY